MKIKLSLDFIIELNKELVKFTQDTFGIVSLSSIDFALAHIKHNNNQKNFFKNLALLLRNIIGQHPFLDGNKRTGLCLIENILENYNLKLNLINRQKELFVINIALGKFDDLTKLAKYIKSKVISV